MAQNSLGISMAKNNLASMQLDYIFGLKIDYYIFEHNIIFLHFKNYTLFRTSKRKKMIPVRGQADKD